MYSDVDFQALLSASIQDELGAEMSDAIATIDGAKRPRSPASGSITKSFTATHQQSEGTPACKPPQASRHTKRAAKRLKIIAAEGHKPKERTLNDVVQLSEPYEAELEMKSLGVANGGYSAIREKLDETAEQEYMLHELTENLGFKVIGWDGK